MTTHPGFIPITSVHVTQEEKDLVLEVLESGQLAQGPRVTDLESAFRRAANTRHAIAVSSGTAALFLALEALDLQPGDEVITSPFTFIATLNAILTAGATVRFADIGDDYNLDPESVAALVNARTRVLVPVHLYGLPADMGSLSDIASSNDHVIVEDAAQAIGASVDGRPVGSWGLGCFSMYATKNVTTAEGGMVTTDDPVVADRLRLLRNQGMRARYEYEIPGYNLRLTDLQAALGIPQMQRLDETTETRRRNAQRLTAGLEGLDGIRVPIEPVGRRHVYHQYTIAVTPAAPVGRDDLAAHLGRLGIGTGVYYRKLVNDYAPFRGHGRVASDPTPKAQEAADSVLSLPVHPALTNTDLNRTIDGVRRVLHA